MKQISTHKRRITGIAAVVVAVIMLWSVSGHVLWHVARQACYNYVHHIKKERSFRDTLVLDNEVYNDASRLVWVKKDEIRYGGRMFDIKDQIRRGNVTVLIGHYDDFEHHLYKYLGRLFDDDNQPTQKTDKHWHTLIAVLPEEKVSEHTHAFTSLSHTCQWANPFRLSVDVPPLHNPPDIATA
ncbi:MAG TPA: hypothetical protein VIN07_04805 [Flavipsychrobacter sp.]